MPPSTANPPREWDIRRFEEIDSTNSWLLEQARSGAPEGLVALADVQTAGRGRLGRAWVAPPGASMLVSVLLRPPAAVVPLERAHLVIAVAALAAADACADVAGVEPGLKWPNDLLVDGRKLAGILAETVVTGRRLEGVVVGVGLNVNWPEPSLVPAELDGIAVALNHLAGHPIDRDAVLDAFLARLAEHDAELRRPAGPERIAAAVRARSVTLGQRVKVDLGATVLDGVAEDIDEGGHLVVRDDGGRLHQVAAGDVSLTRRP